MENRRYQIQFTPLSYEDLDEIDTYISQVLQAPQAAQALMVAMEQSITQLQQFLYLSRSLADVYLADKGYRKLVVENYLVFYLVDELQRRVVIMRVLYGAREYHGLL